MGTRLREGKGMAAFFHLQLSDLGPTGKIQFPNKFNSDVCMRVFFCFFVCFLSTVVHQIC